MTRILCSADWHIIRDKKKIPEDWQVNRFNMFFDKMLEIEKTCDIHILAGDIFDKAPTFGEVCLFNSYLNRVTIPTLIIPGNHEATKKGESFLEHYIEDNVIDNKNVYIFTKNARFNFRHHMNFQLFPYGEMQKDNLPSYVEGDILVTHIRGEVPPHVQPEYDFEKLRPWKLILLGDLHNQHKYKDFPAYYPGSPMNVTFDRNENRIYGVNIIDFGSIDNYSITSLDLSLPKLIRKTISSTDELIADDYNHVIYEVTGSLDELSNIKQHDLLDKKIAHKPNEDSKIDLTNMSMIEELNTYLEYNKISDIKGVLSTFSELNV